MSQSLSWFQKLSDPSVVLHRLEQQENIAESEYEQLTGRVHRPRRPRRRPTRWRARSASTPGRCTRWPARRPSPRKMLDTILGRERWHVRGTGWIGDAIYGVNDGLGAVFGIVSGMAGYTGGSEVVLAAGLAGTLASALSMGAGAYLASKSEREVYESEVTRERRELEDDPEEERTELELFYQLKGFSPEEARTMVGRLMAGQEGVPQGARPRGTRPHRGELPQPDSLDRLGHALDRHRRLHPDHPVLLHRRHAGRDRVVHHQHDRALRRRRIEGARHDAVVVGERHRDDRRRDPRSRDHLRRSASRSRD